MDLMNEEFDRERGITSQGNSELNQGEMPMEIDTSHQDLHHTPKKRIPSFHFVKIEMQFLMESRVFLLSCAIKFDCIQAKLVMIQPLGFVLLTIRSTSLKFQVELTVESPVGRTLVKIELHE